MRLFRNLGATLALLAASALPSTAQRADDDLNGFIEANIIAVFYHELGHALIDMLQLPVFGQEEDAADVFSAVLAFEVMETESAVYVVLASADAFRFHAEDAEGRGEAPFFWDEHGPDRQRYFTLLCLAHGGDPDGTADVVETGELPEDRADGCPDEFNLAADSWGAVIDDLAAANSQGPMIRLGRNRPVHAAWGQLMVEVLAQQAEWLNEDYGLDQPITVDIEECGEANAFYAVGEANIVMCTELFDLLAETYSAPN